MSIFPIIGKSAGHRVSAKRALRNLVIKSKNKAQLDENIKAYAKEQNKPKIYEDYIKADTQFKEKVANAMTRADENLRAKEKQNSNISKALKDLQAQEKPLNLDETQLKELLSRFNNVENIKKHLDTRTDSVQRKALFNLLDTTMKEPHFHYVKDKKDKFLKKFKSDDKEAFFYLLITKDGNKNFITHLKTRDYKYLERELSNADELIKGADIIEGLRQQAGASKETINPQPPKSNSTTNKDLSQENTIKGQDFSTNEASINPAKSDLSVKMKLEGQTRDLAKLSSDEIFADLDFLAKKHPGMFKKPSDVFRLIKEIKDNPTHFYNNNRLDASLIVKRLNNKKIGKMVVKKDNGQVIHATKVTDKDLNRLEKVSKANEKQLSALSKLSSDKVANQNNELGLPDKLNNTTKALKSQDKDNLTQNENMLKNSQNFNISKDLEQASLYQMQGKLLETQEKFNHLKAKEAVKAYNLLEKIKTGAENQIQAHRKAYEDFLNIKPIKDFGTNYAEFYHDGKGAIKKLLKEKQGQVAGAFKKEGLGDIDLVWGNEKLGLKKIIDKHLDDFASFKGDTKEEKLANALSEIIAKGKLISKNGIDTIYYRNADIYFAVGLSKGWHGKASNSWIITSYEKKNIPQELKDKIDSSSEAFSAKH